MKRLPFDIGAIHFVGIGGIGMSGIAEVMHNLGYRVQGSDLADNANVQRLKGMGVPVFIGQKAENLGEAGVVVISSAVKRDNPEVVAARERHLPIVRRAEMLAELMRLKLCVAIAGTHGKTTTTSMVAALLEGGGFDPTVINGGIINAYGTNARLGDGDWMVVEADESDGTFVKLPATVAIITNIDPEHMEHYGTLDALRAAFLSFVHNLPFYGFAVACVDHPEVQALMGRVEDRRILTYGVSPQADARAIDISFSNGVSRFNVEIRDRHKGTQHRIDGIELPMPGRHNVLNALSAITVAKELGVSDDAIRGAFKAFGGVKRRFTRTGTWNSVAIIDDYGHHPVEIAAVLKAARESTQGKVIAVVQPHRYSRLSALFEDFCTCFNEADTVIVADVYSAGEQPITGADRDGLVAGLQAHGHRDARAFEAPEKLAETIRGIAQPGDMVICLGAGNITQWANALPGQLAALDGKGGA
jgi:UDP-N-acetylmuramate--alanine ligase